MAQAQLKPGGKLLLFVFACALIGAGVYKLRDQIFPEVKGPGKIDFAKLKQIREQGGQATPAPAATQPAPAGVTTVDAYKYVNRQGVREVQGISSYRFEDNTVVFPINIWGGWAPIIAANNGFAPSEESVFFKKYGFKVNLKLIDDPDAARNAYASGASHVLWGTLDMIALFAEGLSKDSRIMPRVFMQVDWSNGGDGIVARAHVQTANDLRNRTIVLAQNSPSHYYILSVLAEAGIQPSEVNFKFTDTAFGAARAFLETPSIDACVSWAPDIYNIVDEKNGGKRGGVKGAHLLTTTGDANQLIADVFAVRADFARDHPKIVEGLVRGIFEGMDMAAKNPKGVADLMGRGFSLDAGECEAMMKDAHSTNFAENLKFFLDKDFGANFARTWQSASYVYRAYGAIGTPVRADEVMDPSVLLKLKKEGAFAHHKDTYTPDFTAKPTSLKNLEANPIVTKTVQIRFKPNSWEVDKEFDREIPRSLEEIGSLAEKFGGARIVVEGNVDTSRKLEVQRQGPRIYQIFTKDVQELSEKRAKSVKDAVLKQFPNIPRQKITVIGNGWDNPISLTDHGKNRRVEVKVFRLEG